MGSMGRRLAWILWLVGAAAPALGAELRPHDILLLDSRLAAVLRVDPVSGDREVITSPQVGTGRRFEHATDLELAPDGALLVLDRNRYTVVRVDPATGDRSDLMPPSRALGALRGITRSPQGEYWIACSGRTSSSGAIHRLDPVTGETRPLEWRKGQDLSRLGIPIGLAFLDSRLFVADSLVGVLEIDSGTGEGRLIAGAGRDEAEVREPYDLAVGTDGTVFVADKAGQRIVRVPSEGGRVSTVSGPEVGSGPAIASPSGLAIAGNGDLLLADRGRPAILQVDPASGARQLLASAQVGRGPLGTPRRLFVVPGGPARLPAALWAGAALLVLGLLLVAGRRWLRRRG